MAPWLVVFIGVMYALYGLLVGSFLNVCIYRIPRRCFFAKSHSYCPHCGTPLKWYDMFPIISYLVLGGRCRSCKERISIRYPLVEGANALLWLTAYLVYGFNWYSIVLCLLFSIMLIASCIDLDIMEIPNGLPIAMAVLGVAPFVGSFFGVFPTLVPWWGYLVGIVAVSLPLFLLALLTRGGVGGGDIKLMAALGFFAGWPLALLGTLFGFVLGGLVGMVALIAKGKRNMAIPFGPSLCLGMVLSLLFGNSIIAWFIALF